ncbi:MAG: Clp protease N-terminal domain-containing protein [Candidatus Dormibacteria bacterium]
MRAYQEAGAAERMVVGTGHLLLGAVRDEGTVGNLLGSLGVSLAAARAAVEAAVEAEAVRTGQPIRHSGRRRLSSRAIQALAAAGGRAEGRHARWVGPQDILVGIVSQSGSTAGRVLGALGVDVAVLEDSLPPDDEGSPT